MPTTLNFNTETVHQVASRELEKFVSAHYNLSGRWSFVADQECGNDSSHTFNVEKEELDEYDAEKIAELKAGKNPSFVTQALLTDFCNQDLIPEGKYIINVCW